MGWGPESRILLNTSSQKTFRSLLGATGRFPVRPESGDSAQYFLKKNLPVAFQAAGKSRYRLALLPTDSGICIKNVILALASRTFALKVRNRLRARHCRVGHILI